MENDFTRRSAIKLVGSSAALGSLPTLGAARGGDQGRSLEELAEQSIKISEETGDPEKGHKFLRNQGVGVTSKQNKYEIERADPENVSSQSFSKDSLDIRLDLYHFYDDYQATVAIDYDWGFFDHGSDPFDSLAIYYEPDWWQLRGDSVSEATDAKGYIGYADGSYKGDGPGFIVGDQGYYLFETDTFTQYAHVYLKPTGDFDEDQRAINAEYEHAWYSGQAELKNVGVSYPWGLNVSYSPSSVNTWSTDTEQDGDTFLEVYQEDVV